MKHFLIALALLCSFPSFADEEPTIKDSMRVIGRNFGMLSRALFQFKEVNESNIDNAKAIQQSSANAATKYPDTAQTAEEKAEYSQMMNQLTKEAMNMETEIKNVLELNEDPQDLSKCIEIQQRMDKLQQDGHDKFR